MSETRGPVEIADALAAPFDAGEVKFKPAIVVGNRAKALAYVDARAIQDRLDEVLGVTGWQDEYQSLEDGAVICKLSLKIADEWITKTDVGGASEQPDAGDRRKAAFSDALKRAAVKFGIGRYLYRLPAIWCDYDVQKKKFAKEPTLPGTLRGTEIVASYKPARPQRSEKRIGTSAPSDKAFADAKEQVRSAASMETLEHFHGRYTRRGYSADQVEELNALAEDRRRELQEQAAQKFMAAAGRRA